MLKKLFTLGLLLLLSFSLVQAQDEEEAPDLTISGSVDTYFKYDFSSYGNIPTSFASDQNSISIGMVNLIASQEVGKASFVADIAFGPRGQGSSIPNAAGGGSSFHVQNLYVSYALTDQLSITGGYMGTFVGYEIISPTGNFNYSTSYLFTNGPFQNAGVKLDYAISDKFGVMVGLFNDWNVYTTDPSVGVTDFGAQLYVSPVDGWDAYINFVTGPTNQEIDLTTTFQVTDDLLLGLNAATWSAQADGNDGEFTGAALYVNYAISDAFALGLRGETFSTKNTEYIGKGFDDTGATVEAESVTAITLSANIGSGPLKLIPEIRFDSADQDVFMDGDGMATGGAAQFLVAAVYAF